MKKIKLTITALSPLAIATRKPGSITEAEDYIPGSVIRGAIASQILQLAQQQKKGYIVRKSDRNWW